MKKVITLAVIATLALGILAGCAQVKEQATDAGNEVSQGVADIWEASDKFLAETKDTLTNGYADFKTELKENVEDSTGYLTKGKPEMDLALDDLKIEAEKIDTSSDSELKTANEEYIRLIEAGKVENQKIADAITNGAQEQYDAAKTALQDHIDKINNYGK